MRTRTAATILGLALLIGAPGALGQEDVDRDLVADLVADLGDPEAHVRDEAADALARIGEPVVGDLLAVIKKGLDPARLEAVLALGRMGPLAADTVPVLEAFVKADDTRLRDAARAALKRILPPEGPAASPEQVPIETLVDALAAESREDQLDAIRALGRRLSDRERAADALGPLLDARDEVVFVETVRALARLRTDFMADALLERMGRWPTRVRFEIIDAAYAMGEGAVPALVRRMAALHTTRKDADGVRPWFQGLAWEIGSPVVPHALAALTSEETGVRAAGAELLGAVRIDVTRAAPALVDALGDAAGVVRREAAGSLGRFGVEGSEFSIPALALVLADKKSRAQTEAADALGAILIASARRSPRTAGRSAEIRASVDQALDWLARHQSADGSWDSDGFGHADKADDRCEGGGEAHYDLGQTALATLAFQQRGSTGRLDAATDRYGPVVRRALRFVASHQDGEGRIGMHSSQHWFYVHAIATLALADGYARSGSPLLGHFTQRAAEYIGRARDPEGGWRYEPRHLTDTSVSGWMVSALGAARRAGLHTDPDARVPLLKYLAAATNAENGRTGYMLGSPNCARTNEQLTAFPQSRTEAMTASALRQWLELGLDIRERPVAAAIDRCLAVRPVWNTEDGSTDLYYWYHASVALNHVGGDAARGWNTALKKALLAGQQTDDDRCDAGSWDPVGPWGLAGGRIYTTAVAALSLEAANGLSLPLQRSAAKHPPTVKALRALEQAAGNEETRESVRDAARRALTAHERY